MALEYSIVGAASCDFAQDIFGKAESSDASEPAGGVAMASQFASLQPAT